MKMGEKVVIDIPGNRCFGCGPTNPVGLRLAFERTGAHRVQTRFQASPDHCGSEGVVHGGIQAVVLDEVLGVAIRAEYDDASSDEPVHAVTAEFNLKYKRPTPVGDELIAEGDFLRREGRNIFLEGRILSSAGDILSTAEARWVVLAPRD